MALTTGEKAPNFTLPCCDGEDFDDVDLGSLLEDENVVLAYFPLAFSPVCTDEMCNFRDMLDELNELDAQVYGISVDSPFVLNEFIQKENLNFPIFSDFNRETLDEYGVREEDLIGLEGVAQRSVFVIDRDGTVQYAWNTEDPSNHPDYDAIKEHLRNLS